MAGIWCQESLDTSTCGIGITPPDMVSESIDSGAPTGYRNWMGFVQKPYFCSQENPQTHPHPAMIWELTRRLGEVSSESRMYLETLISYTIFSNLQKADLQVYLSGLWYGSILS